MNKIGEGKNPSKTLSAHDYQKALQHNCTHFLAALREYPSAKTEDRKRLAGVMSEQLKLIVSDVSELKRLGISKEAVLLEKACKAYLSEDSGENLAALEHHLATLCEFNC